MKRINVVGTSASGKSTFSKVLAQKLGLSYIELDDLFWLDNWDESSDPNFFEKLQQSIDLAPHGHVIDGNYSRTEEIKWTQQKLWSNSNNRESFKSMLSRDSIIWWMIKTHKKNQHKYLQMMQSNEYAHILWIRLCSRSEIKNFLKSL